MTRTRHDTAASALARLVLAGALTAVAVGGTAVARADAGSAAPASTQPSTVPPTVSPGISATASQAFSTPIPPDAATAWTGIDWRPVAPGEPLGQVRSVVRWRGGFIALGAEVMEEGTWRTPAWSSTDGAMWQPLGTDVFGSGSIILGVGETANGVVALTLASGTNQCGSEPLEFSCSTLAAPLQSWTSPDAIAWTAHPGPEGIAIQDPECQDCGVAVPIFRSGIPGLLAVDVFGATPPTGSRMAFSQDGISWETVPADAFPDRFDVNDVAASGSGFIATGEQGVAGSGDDTIRAVVLTSHDGLTWVPRDLPTAGLRPTDGSSAGRIVAGPGGLIVTGSDDAVPGTELWWSKVASTAWSQLTGYPPLGTWTGDGEGSGLIPDGTLIGDGERLVAYRGGTAPSSWTSLDGRSWHDLAISGAGPTNAGDWPLQALTLTPIGLLATSDDGTQWFGAPRT